MYRYSKRVVNSDYILEWKFTGLSDEKIKHPSGPHNFLNPLLKYFCSKTKVRFRGGCLKQDKITYNHWKIVNVCIVYGTKKPGNTSSYWTLENCFIGAVGLTKMLILISINILDKELNLIDWIGFFSHPSGRTDRNVTIFGVGVSSSTKIDDSKIDILILGKGPTQGLEHILSAENMYSINFTENNKKICLSLHYNGANSYSFVNA